MKNAWKGPRLALASRGGGRACRVHGMAGRTYQMCWDWWMRQGRLGRVVLDVVGRKGRRDETSKLHNKGSMCAYN